jgi:hypothetical protein
MLALKSKLGMIAGVFAVSFGAAPAQSLDTKGKPANASTVNCGVRAVEGEHRTYVTDFVRDARGGGCAVSKPPSNLGFRLVRATSTSCLGLYLNWMRFPLRSRRPVVRAMPPLSGAE